MENNEKVTEAKVRGEKNQKKVVSTKNIHKKY